MCPVTPSSAPERFRYNPLSYRAFKYYGATDYFQTNAVRKRYADFRNQGLFVGSGVIEADCKTVTGQRLKQSGMHWSVRGANAIVA